jgi:1-acyl-sn-glycerol-3-phosphate acyltransferase
MWNVTVDGAMPGFWPPKPHPFWTFLLTPLRRYFLHGYMRMTQVEVEGLDDFRKRFAPGDGVLIAPNHSHDADPHVMVDVSRQLAQQFYFMAAWQVFRNQGGWAGFVMQRMGAFSVDREGCDRRAVKTAIELLATGQRLVVFPEGEIYHLNDRLAPLLDGVAFMALSAQKDLEKTKPEARVWMVPTAIRYRHVEDVTPKAEVCLARMEQRFLLKPPAGADLPQRITRLGEMLLTLKEKEKLGRARDGEGDLPARLSFLADALLTGLEQDWLKKSPSADSPPLRVKAVRRKLMDVYTSESSDVVMRTKAREALDTVHLALQIASYPGNYLLERPTHDRIVETLQQMEEDMLNAKIRPLGRRQAKVIFGEPIDLKAKMGLGRTRTLASDVTDELEDRMRQLLSRDFSRS